MEKDGTPFGKPKTLETLAHDSIYLYIFDESVGSGFLRVTGMAELEDGHPLVYWRPLATGSMVTRGQVLLFTTSPGFWVEVR